MFVETNVSVYLVHIPHGAFLARRHLWRITGASLCRFASSYCCVRFRLNLDLIMLLPIMSWRAHPAAALRAHTPTGIPMPPLTPLQVADEQEVEWDGHRRRGRVRATQVEGLSDATLQCNYSYGIALVSVGRKETCCGIRRPKIRGKAASPCVFLIVPFSQAFLSRLSCEYCHNE